MALFDYKCKCGYSTELIVNNSKMDEQKCPKCGKIMDRQFPNKFNFKLVFNNKTDMCSWGYEGYATSRYWDDVKKQKEKEGKIQTTVPDMSKIKSNG